MELHEAICHLQKALPRGNQYTIEAWQTLKHVVEIANSAQQLKAEIAALANLLHTCEYDRSWKAVDDVVYKLRRLSAV